MAPGADIVDALADAEMGVYGNEPYKWTGGHTIFFDLSDEYYVDLYTRAPVPPGPRRHAGTS